MATIIVTNISASPVYLSDFYASLDVGESISVTRPMTSLGSFTSLLSLSQAGTVSYSLTPSADEIAEGALIGSGSDATAIHDNIPGEINALSEKITPVGADLLIIEDSAASNAKKKIQISAVAGGAGSDTTAIHDDTAGEIAAVTAKATPVGGDFLLIEDSAAANVKKSITLADLPAATHVGGGVDSVQVGTSADSSGARSAAFGEFATVDVAADDGIAVGPGAYANAVDAAALGHNAVADGVGASAFGVSADAGGAAATALGSNSDAGGDRAVAAGSLAVAAGADGIAIGTGAAAPYADSIAIGNGASPGTGSNASDNIAIGRDATISGNYVESMAIGADAIAGNGGVAVGPGADSSGTNSLAVGRNSLANASQATAVGPAANCEGSLSVAFGYNANALSASQSCAIGAQSDSSGANTTAVGSFAQASAVGATAVGRNTFAATNGTATGLDAKANASGSIAVGQAAVINAAHTDSVAIGRTAISDKAGQFAFGAVAVPLEPKFHADSMVLTTAKTPSSATDTGETGQIAWDATYFYICVATNTWQRVLHATW